MASIKKQQKAAQAKQKAAATQRKKVQAAAAKAAAEKAKVGYNEQLSTLSPEQQGLQSKIIQQAQGGLGNLQPYNPQQGQQQDMPSQEQIQQAEQAAAQGDMSYWDQLKSYFPAVQNYLTTNSPIAAAGSPLDKAYNQLTQTDYSKPNYQGSNSGLGSLAGGLIDKYAQNSSFIPDTLKPYLPSLSSLTNTSVPTDYSNPGFLNDLYNYATQTDYGQDQVTPQAVNQGFQPYEAQMRQGFNEGTVPGLAERFTSLGGGRLGSPTFAQQLGQAGRGLEGDINAARETYRQGQQQYNLGNRQVGLQQRQYNKANDISNRQLGLSQEGQRQSNDFANRQLGLNQEGQRFNQTLAQQNNATQQQQFGQQFNQNQQQYDRSHQLQQQEQNRLGQQQQFGQGYDLARLAVNPNVENMYHAPQQSFGKQLLTGLAGAGANVAAAYAGKNINR